MTGMGLTQKSGQAPDGRLTTLMYVPDLRPSSIALGLEGLLYVSQDLGGTSGSGQKSVFRFEADGSLSLVAGGLFPAGNFNGQDGQFARGATFATVRAIALGPDGALFVGQVINANNANGVHKITSELPGQSVGEIVYPSRDGRELYFFSTRGRHLRTQDALTGVVKYMFRYDDVGRLLSITDANGDSTVTSRNATTGAPTAITAPYGQTTVLGMDTSGKYLASIQDPAGQTHTLTYYSGADEGLLHTFTNPRSKTWTYSYGSTDGRLTRDDDPAGGSNTLSQSESGTSRTVTRTTGEGRVTKYTVMQMLDGLRRRFIDHPDGSKYSSVDSMSTVAPYGEVVRTTTPAGAVTVARPSRDYRLGWFAPVDSALGISLPSGLRDSITQSRSFANGKRWESVAVNGKRFYTSYDTAQRVLTVTTPLGRTRTVTFDAAGRPTRTQTGALHPFEFAHDGQGKLIHVGQGWRAWRYAYDDFGRLVAVTDTLDRTTSFAYDDADRDTMEALPGDREVHFGYDEVGNLTRLTSPGGAAHTFEYTPVDLNDTYTPPSVTGISDPATRYEFNLDRQLTGITRPDTTVTLDYDGYGRLWKIHHTQGVAEFGYTTNPSTGQLKTATSPGGTILTEDYDGPLLKKETWSGTIAGSVERTFDSWFRDTTEKVNGGSEVGFLYDDDGLQVGAGSLFIHRRSSDGLIDSTRAGVMGSHAFYNNQGELTDLQYTMADTVFFRQFLYRDAVGRITRIAETVDGQTHTKVFRYDLAGRLDSVAVDSVHVAAYRYADNSNRTQVLTANGDTVLTATYDAQDRMLRYGAVAYSYTTNGELAKVWRSSTDSTQFTYDPLGNLIRVKTPDGHQVDYVTDGLNRRVGYRVDGVLQRVWLYRNGLSPVAELDRQGNLVSRYVYGTQSHVPDLLLQANHGYRVVTEYLGSVRAVVDTADGAVAQRIDYDAWGVRLADTAPTLQLLGFAGGLTDSASALVRFGARDHDPVVGRWTSRDPNASSLLTSNLYAYAAQDPVNAVDPAGTREFATASVGAGGGGPGWSSECSTTYVYDPCTGQVCQFTTCGFGVSLAVPGIPSFGGAIQGGVLNADKMHDIKGFGLSVSAGAAAGKGISGHVAGGIPGGPAYFGFGGGFMGGVGAGISGSLTRTWEGPCVDIAAVAENIRRVLTGGGKR